MEQSEEKSIVTTRDAGIRYGLFAAGVSIVFFLIPAILGQNAFQGMWSWISMPIIIILFVLAHKYYKDEGDGFMSYGKGIAISFWMSLISTLLGGLFVFVYVNFLDSAPFDTMLEETRSKMEEQGSPEEAIEMGMTWTKNLFWPMYAIGGIIGGLILALIVTIFTQKNNPEPNF